MPELPNDQPLLIRLKSQAEIIAKEQTGFKAGPLPCFNRLQQGLRHGLQCSFVGNHEEVQRQHQPYPSHLLYDKAICAVLFKSSIGDWFRTTVGIR